jgi:hypothetical protein
MTFLDGQEDDRVTYFGGLEDADRLWRLSWRWHGLVQVCQRWRSVVFASPNFLDLSLVCRPWTRVELIGIWPPLPIIIRDMVNWPMPEDYDFDAAIVHHNRICEIVLLYLTSLQLQRLALAMQERFPALIHLILGFTSSTSYHSHPASAPALPDGFLGGSIPRLQTLSLHCIAFPALPKLLLSATDLVRLSLRDIPHSGYISPEAVVSGLAGSANLKSLTIAFKSPLSCPNRERRSPPPQIRNVLPALTRFEFQGVSEYLEELVARIDTPLLDSIWVTLFSQLVFDIPQFAQFMERTTRFNEVHVDFDSNGVQFESLSPTQTSNETSGLRISCRELDWQLSSLAQVTTSFFPSIYMVEHLYISGSLHLPSQWQDDIENVQWLEIFYPFFAVKNLYVSKEFARCIAFSLQELVGERAADVFPALETLFLEELRPSGPVKEAIGQFVAARQLLGHPVAVSDWNRA